MTSATYISKKKFADQLGVWPGTITAKFPKGHRALVGNKIDTSHEDVQEYIQEREERKNQTPAKPNRAKPIPQPNFIAPVIPEDVPKPQLPEELAELTLREIVNLYGHLPGFKSYVSSLKELENLKLKTTKSQHDRGLLINRANEGQVLLEILEMCFKKLVDEVPKSTIRQIIGIALRNDSDTEIAATRVYKEANSRALKICKNEILSRLETTEEELLGEKNVG